MCWGGRASSCPRTCPRPHHHGLHLSLLEVDCRSGWTRNGGIGLEDNCTKTGRPRGQVHLNDVSKDEVLVDAGAQEGSLFLDHFRQSGERGTQPWARPQLCLLPAGTCPHFSKPLFLCL